MTEYDALVVGSGIAGMESALKLGDMGYKVLLVEKEASVGGRMILLSKVFPTLDCASCISTPKMAASIHHPNVTALTCTEVDGISRGGNGRFRATIRRKPRFVDETACTGCQLCETACTVAVPDQFNADMVARRAAYITFPQAVPKKAVLERAGTSPCTYTCPAGIKAHGYVSLIRSGDYEKAFQLVLDATPLVGTLGRACYAPCESDCTRGSLEGTLPIRRLKRFAADQHYASMDGPGVEVPPPNGKRVAIVGSGPAGLTAAWQLARLGYGVKIFEAAPVAGGFLRLAIPAYRLPPAVVEQDISNVTALGVEIATNSPVSDLEALRRDGFDAVLVATGTQASTSLNVPGENLDGVVPGLKFLRATKLGSTVDLTGKRELAGRRVVVVGGGNVAMDAARTAVRLGAAEITVAYRRGREEMPAHKAEVDDAEHDGVKFSFLVAPVEVLGDAHRDAAGASVGAVTGLRCQRMALGVPDASGRRRPEPIKGSEFVIPCDTVLVAIGMAPEGSAFGSALPVNDNGTLIVDKRTLQTAIPHIFAAGDATTGASDITRAVGQGRRAAHMIDRWLNHEPLAGFEMDDLLPLVDKPTVLARQKLYSRHGEIGGAAEAPGSAPPARAGWAEIEPALTEPEARASAGDCLDCGVCSECGECVAVCPSDAIHLDMREQIEEVDVGAVVVATGYKLFTADAKPEYGFGRYKNVITGMQMDRLLAPTRPFNTVLRPGDGKIPERIAYILCTGSRDEAPGPDGRGGVDNPLCSRFCCMYSIKQNQLVMGALPLAEVTVHYMDIRAPGKRYDEFYEGAKAMGATYVKGRVAKITEKPDGNLILRYEDIEHGGAIVEAEYDMVVLAIGVQPNREVERLFTGDDAIELNDYHYVAEPNEDIDPGCTNIPGVFVAGTASGAKDIADSILHAGAAVAQVAAHLERGSGAAGNRQVQTLKVPA